MLYHQDGTLPTNSEIFVFGSNLAGRHGAGAARVANRLYGAIYGAGVGPMGNSYAIPTKDYNIKTLDLVTISKHIHDFLDYAKENKHLVFWLTSIGTGLAGYSVSQIAPFFLECILDNISYPDAFVRYFNSQSKSFTNV